MTTKKAIARAGKRTKAKKAAKKPGTALALAVPNQVDAQPRSVIAAIAKMAADPRCNPTAIRELLEIQKDIMASQARIDFIEAFHRMADELPVIAQNGRIEIYDKNTKKLIQSTPFAKWVDMNEVIKPILARNGFILRFMSGSEPDGRPIVYGVLSHRGGHGEESKLSLPFDASGSKNNVQGIGSSISYGKRYITVGLLNLISRAPTDQDDDAKVAGDAEMAAISDEQFQELEDKIKTSGADRVKFRAHFSVESTRELPRRRFDEAMKMLDQRASRKAS